MTGRDCARIGHGHHHGVHLLLAALAKHPSTPPVALRALAGLLAHRTSTAGQTAARFLYTNPATPDDVAASIDLALTFPSDLIELFASATPATPPERLRAALAAAPTAAVARFGLIRNAPPEARAVALDLMRSGQHTKAMNLIVCPDVTGSDLADVVHTQLTTAPVAPTSYVVSVATRTMPERLREFATIACDAPTRAALARYADIAEAGADPHRQRLADLADLAPTSLAAAITLLIDPATDPTTTLEVMVATSRTNARAGRMLATAALPTLVGTPAEWTATVLAALDKDVPISAPITSADRALTTLADLKVADANLSLTRTLLPRVSDPRTVATWAARTASIPADKLAVLLHPATDPVTRRVLADHLLPSARVVGVAARLSEDPAALRGLPVAFTPADPALEPAFLAALGPVAAELAGPLTDPAVARAFVALAPTFTGTIAELATTAVALTT